MMMKTRNSMAAATQGRGARSEIKAARNPITGEKG